MDTVGVWQRLFEAHYVSHGLGAATAIGMSGIDLALWDIRGEASALPLYRLLGGSRRALAAYAGGLTLGFQPAEALVEESLGYVEAGYPALKLCVGDRPAWDVGRVHAVRVALGDHVEILTDANAAYGLDEVRSHLPGLDEAHVGWLEEPFPPFDTHVYAVASRLGHPPGRW